MTKTYDFIIVGGGPAGSVVASRLARQIPNIEVLLLEGGGTNSDLVHRSPEVRYALPFTQPELNWLYKSTPQAQLNERIIACHRGRGLGGSSAINFSGWLLGDKEDFNEWAERVDDLVWKWDGNNGVKERFRKIEKLDYEGNEARDKFLDKEALSLHSREGMVGLSQGQHWPEHATILFKAAKEFGLRINGDINSGDPTGIGLGPSTFHNGLRVTASSAYLSSPPPNLTLTVDSFVSRVLIDDHKRAVGVETLSGETYTASKEIILSAGSLDTPKLLLLSGIGPAAELSALDIRVIEDVPGVGKNLTDHCYATSTLLLKPQAPLPVLALNPLLQVGLEVPMAWISSSTVKSSPEFKALALEKQNWLKKLPSYQFLLPDVPLAAERLGPEAFADGAKLMTFAAVVMNGQSRGSVSLSSADPTGPAINDVNYLSHPYDRRVMIEGLRAVTKFSEVPSIAAITERRLEGPPGDSDDETFFEHAKIAVNPMWHFAGTCRMGKEGDESAVVDKEFKVKGLKGLRIVDLSVAAVLPNNHVQSTAYLVGETAAEKLIAEYKLSGQYSTAKVMQNACRTLLPWAESNC